MGKKKKTYVRPEMKIIEVKTEGVIAASGGGGDIEIPDIPETMMAELKENCTKNGNYKLVGVGQCLPLITNYTPCSTTWNEIWMKYGQPGETNPFINNPNIEICQPKEGLYTIRILDKTN